VFTVPTLTARSAPVDTIPITALLNTTEAASIEASLRFQSTTSPLGPRTSPLLEDTQIWREDQAPSLRCRKCTRLSLASHFITRELTTLLVPSTVRGTRFTTGVDHSFGTIECKTQMVTALVVTMR
jgi:hypothetical protein